MDFVTAPCVSDTLLHNQLVAVKLSISVEIIDIWRSWGDVIGLKFINIIRINHCELERRGYIVAFNEQIMFIVWLEWSWLPEKKS